MRHVIQRVRIPAFTRDKLPGFDHDALVPPRPSFLERTPDERKAWRKWSGDYRRRLRDAEQIIAGNERDDQ